MATFDGLFDPAKVAEKRRQDAKAMHDNTLAFLAAPGPPIVGKPPAAEAPGPPRATAPGPPKSVGARNPSAAVAAGAVAPAICDAASGAALGAVGGAGRGERLVECALCGRRAADAARERADGRRDGKGGGEVVGDLEEHRRVVVVLDRDGLVADVAGVHGGPCAQKSQPWHLQRPQWSS